MINQERHNKIFGGWFEGAGCLSAPIVAAIGVAYLFINLVSKLRYRNRK